MVQVSYISVKIYASTNHRDGQLKNRFFFLLEINRMSSDMIELIFDTISLCGRWRKAIFFFSMFEICVKLCISYVFVNNCIKFSSLLDVWERGGIKINHRILTICWSVQAHFLWPPKRSFFLLWSLLCSYARCMRPPMYLFPSLIESPHLEVSEELPWPDLRHLGHLLQEVVVDLVGDPAGAGREDKVPDDNNGRRLKELLLT